LKFFREEEKTLSGDKTLLMGSANSATSSSATYNIKITTLNSRNKLEKQK
jgi:hypothetical protein